jgi:hypothetical protein
MSVLIHGAVVGLVLFFSYAATNVVQDNPKVFELVAGAGDNYGGDRGPGARQQRRGETPFPARGPGGARAGPGAAAVPDPVGAARGGPAKAAPPRPPSPSTWSRN